MLTGSVLLYGPSGCGKTLSAMALFGEAGQEFVRIVTYEVLRDPLGNLKRVFEAIEQHYQKGILLENIDDLLSDLRGQPAARRYLLDRLASVPNSGILVATAQRPESMQEAECAVFRLVLPVWYPNEAERLDILRRKSVGTSLEGAAVLEEAARPTEWWSGLELEEFVARALKCGENLSSDDVARLIRSTVSIPEMARAARMSELQVFTEKYCTSAEIIQNLRSRFGLPKQSGVITPPSGTGTLVIANVFKEGIMGDSYKIEQAGAVGPGAQAQNMTFSQIWQEMQGIDAATLAQQLTKLRAALSREAKSAEDYSAIGAIASAEAEVKKGNGAKALEYLSKAGGWAFETATKIGESVAAEVIKAAIGIK